MPDSRLKKPRPLVAHGTLWSDIMPLVGTPAQRRVIRPVYLSDMGGGNGAVFVVSMPSQIGTRIFAAFLYRDREIIPLDRDGREIEGEPEQDHVARFLTREAAKLFAKKVSGYGA